MAGSDGGMTDEDLAHHAGALSALMVLQERQAVLLKREREGRVLRGELEAADVAPLAREMEFRSMPVVLLLRLYEDACRARGVVPREPSRFEREYAASDDVELVGRVIDGMLEDYRAARRPAGSLSQILRPGRYALFVILEERNRRAVAAGEYGAPTPSAALDEAAARPAAVTKPQDGPPIRIRERVRRRVHLRDEDR